MFQNLKNPIINQALNNYKAIQTHCNTKFLILDPITKQALNNYKAIQIHCNIKFLTFEFYQFGDQD